MRMLLCISLMFCFLGLVPLNASASAITTTNWPMFGFDSGHTKWNPYEKTLNRSTVQRLTVVWKQPGRYGFEDSPVVANGVVYCISDDQIVHAYDAHSGAVKWSKLIPYSGYGASVVVENGLLYVGGGDQTSNRGVLYALNVTTGAIVWKTTTSGSGAFAIQSDLTFADGIIYGTWEDGYLRAFNVQTGQQLWNAQTTSGYSSAVIANGLVYVGSDRSYGETNFLYAFHEKIGSVAWKTPIPKNARIGSSPAVSNGIVYVADLDTSQLHAFNATSGHLLWSFTVKQHNNAFINNSPAIVNGTIYMTSTDDHLYALDAKTGTKRWSFATSGEIYSSPAVANGVVYMSSRDNHIYVLSTASGEQLWSYHISTNNDGLDQSSPTVVNGMVFLGLMANLYAFRLP